MLTTEIRHGHLFCGIGAGARGFNKARPKVGNTVAKFRCLGGIDIDAQAIADFGRMTGAAGTVLDLADRSQYIAIHGNEPPAGWHEATTADIHRAMGYERPHIWFLSAPCKGFSGLLSQAKSLTDKYQALNRLTLRGIWLALEAYKDDPVEMILFENVPRIATRGRHLLDQITSLLRSYGYAVAETTHDCGEIGGLAQSRKRFLLVARHQEKVPPFLYEPTKKPLRAVGDVLGRMPMPGAALGGPMHRIPALQWKTWVRLAFVEAGSDWRSLNKLEVEGGNLRDYLIVPENRNGGFLGVGQWDQPRGTVTGRSLPNNGDFSIADPRFDPSAKWLDGQAYGVRAWDKHTGAIAGQQSPGQGGYSVADPRTQVYASGYGVNTWEQSTGAVAGESLPSNGRFAVADPRPPEGKTFTKYPVTKWTSNAGTVIGGDDMGAYAVQDPRHGGPEKHSNEFRVVQWDRASMAVTSAHSTGQTVADPRRAGESFGKYGVTGFEETAGTVISGSTTGQGAFAVADPRPNMKRGKGDNYLTGGHYGVVPWDQHSYAVAAAACLDNGHWSLADPRPMPVADDKLVCRITALDNTWHRPFTTLELAALQSLFDPDDWFHPESEYFTLAGASDQRWREGIGNAVPSDTATAIAEVMGETLLLAWSGETFQLSMRPIWVQPLAIAISVRQAGEMQ
jgi:site-specific DNA-cytosine methylase